MPENDHDWVAKDSTLERLRHPHDQAVRGLWARRATVTLLCLILIAAGTGWMGVHSSTVTATADGYTLQVHYARVARAGLDVPFTVRVTAAEPIEHQIVLGITADYFRMFETQGFYPDPADATTDAGTVYLTFDPPPHGNTLVVDYDAYIQPAAQIGKDATISVILGGVRRVSVTVHTTLLP
ncbi:MAG TPA: hypothetical protein VFM01_17695 [Nakamurella sp.]|nr:hypothetical protein [Nakamurella sp.]